VNRFRRILPVIGSLALVGVTACGPAESEDEPTTTTNTDVSTTAEATTTTSAAVATTTTASEDMGHHDGEGGEADQADVAAAMLGTAAFQDVAMAEASGYGSTMDALGCFESAESGGMGLHYLNESLMDAELDVTAPEALVYELDADGEIVGLVAHEYIVPAEAWTEEAPPSLFGVELHEHPVLPLWVLHTWLWKNNPSGFFNDWNPAVRLCPEGVPVFGVDLP
jgi:hypothetical protein